MYHIPQEKKGFERTSSILASVGKFIFESVETVVVSLAVCVVLYLFLILPEEVVGSSMQPTIRDGEHLIANKLVYNLKDPQRGDIVVVKISETKDLLKRVIGLPDDEISLLNGQVYINGVKLNEEYLDTSTYTSSGENLTEGKSITVPEGQYFIMGDNRLHSFDSRTLGFVSREDIKAKAWVVYFPFNQFRVVTDPDYNE